MKEHQILKITRKAAILKEKKARTETPPTVAADPEFNRDTPGLVAENLPPEPFAPIPQKNRTASETESREWWSQRWIDVLESFGWRRRMERARNYVREGRVLQLEFKQNQVVAKVQGTAPEPYDVELFLDPFTDEQWQFVIEAMASQALFAAKLLAGEMPNTIEEAFTSSGLSLFPYSKFDIHSQCSCPDPVNPCKHIGAVYYLLGEHFSQDPFILFQLRGRTKADLITQLRNLRNQAPTTVAPAPPATDVLPPRLYEPPQLDKFWHYTEPLDPSLVVVLPPEDRFSVLSLLGPIPTTTNPTLTPQAHETLAVLEKVYESLSEIALNLALQGSSD